MEFHISKNARKRYRFSDTLFSYTGNVILANMAACREFAHRMNQVRDVKTHPEQAIHAAQLYAMGLIDEASHVLMARYREQFDPEVMTAALDWFSGQVGADELDTMLLAFVEQFPGQSVMRGLETPSQWLAGQTGGMPHRAAALEELLLLWTANRNQAFKPFEELFEERTLAEKTVYKRVTAQMPEYFASRPLIPLQNAKSVSLLDLLRAPVECSPASLSEQLALIRKLWGVLVGDSLDRFLQIAGEVLREEELAIWMQFNPPAVQAREAAARHRESGRQQWPSFTSHSEVPVFGDPVHEYEHFSPDTAWMPGTVMIAKSTYVWLAQLSRFHSRHIGRLDQIPDSELAALAHRGINTLWLIGVWERSRASQTIKKLCGNQDAVASAYSLFDYRIADDLGGEQAYIHLRDRAYHHGIRLASDMVPNHMGIDSPWVVEHPDWFVARQEPPYPAYSFNGPDLSPDHRVEIKIEDHYYDQSDAAVVFRRRDNASGETRFIYHGNDGTSFPWNDTAQLDYLNPAVREQVIQTILHVARLFPVIRFDAAMTLAKRHFHRLWFPGPGSSGAIPSRAESSMSDADFDRAMPQEFWREVVDRVAAEVPGTLLLAEAFWLMEGYFVRTLGMHRVYNSAFMNMLRDEENAKYRSVIKNTIEFDPDIMKRYVNFMSNPDERTAIDQFGKGDKCFGVAVLMSTLPGLPMFGHGQIEGFTEKYGMEYRWPRYEENPDHWLVERHEREIAPLLKRRWLFAESNNFLLYDFFTGNGSVDENVFAYSNRNGSERALVIYNNRYGSTQGTIDYSAAYADKGSGQLRQRRLADGLGLSGDRSVILAWRNSLTSLEYLHRAHDVLDRGLTVDLNAYQCQVLIDFRELQPSADLPWDNLCDWLNGRGVPDLNNELVNLELGPAHAALQQILDPGVVRRFGDMADQPPNTVGSSVAASDRQRNDLLREIAGYCDNFIEIAGKAYALRLRNDGEVAPSKAEPAPEQNFARELRAILRLCCVESVFPEPWPAAARSVLPSASPQKTATAMWGPVLAWRVLQFLAVSIDPVNPEKIALDLFDRLRLREPLGRSFAALGFEGEEAWRVAARIKVLLLKQAGIGEPQPEAKKQSATEVSSQLPAATGDVATSKLSDSTKPAATEAIPTLKERPAAARKPEAGVEEPPATVASSISLAKTLWHDPDVQWLCGVHESKGQKLLVAESYAELLWWLLLPALLRFAASPRPERAQAQQFSDAVASQLASARVRDLCIDSELTEAAIEDDDTAIKTDSADTAIQTEKPSSEVAGFSTEFE